MPQVTKVVKHPSQQKICLSGMGFSDKITKQLSSGYELVFQDVTVSIGKKEILKDVSGLAKPGEMLAIMGPSGAGKTTLLNCLAGRRNAYSGEITLNSKPLTKQLRRKISYVLQQDIFLTNITCWQTIWYTAMLRLPGSMPTAEKEKRVYEIIDALDMRKCLHTKIGDNFVRGLSGGEKKRTTIACELLTNPALMLLDEPTSGLDSSTAYSLCTTIKQFARTSGKTVVMTIHQPSSQIFSMFDKLLLLCEGKVAYYGDVERCADYFKELELPCPANYNLADHLLDLTKESEDLQAKIIDEAVVTLKKYLTNHGCLEQPKHPEPPESNSHPLENGNSEAKVVVSVNGIEYKDREMEISMANGDTSHVNETFVSSEDVESGEVKFSERITPMYKTDEERTTPDYDEDDDAIKYMDEYNSRWPTSFLLQYLVLVQRLFHQSWPRILSKWNWIQLVVLAAFNGVIWFQIEATEEKIVDRHGLIFFNMTFVGFFGLIDATLSFAPTTLVQLVKSSKTQYKCTYRWIVRACGPNWPQRRWWKRGCLFHRKISGEREVLNKERLAGYYRLSAYYLAKISCELPLLLLPVTVYMTIIYWMSGISLNFLVFLQVMGIHYLIAAVTQGIGGLFGALLMEIQFAMMCSNITMLATMVAGGFYTAYIPFWAVWLRYISYMTYTYHIMLYIQYTNTDIRCAETKSVFDACLNQASFINNHSVMSSDNVTELSFIPRNDLLAKYTWSSNGWLLWHYIFVLIGIIFAFRFLTYLVLRFIRKPHVA